MKYLLALILGLLLIGCGTDEVVETKVRHGIPIDYIQNVDSKPKLCGNYKTLTCYLKMKNGLEEEITMSTKAASRLLDVGTDMWCDLSSFGQ